MASEDFLIDDQGVLPYRILAGASQASYQWEFQDPKMEVPTIYKAYFPGLCKGIFPQKMVLYGTVPPFLDPGIPIDHRWFIT